MYHNVEKAHKKGASVSVMSKVVSENVISGKETLEETLEETPVDLEVVKDNLEEISKKVQNIENRLSEEQENIEKIIESVGEIQTEITATDNMLEESLQQVETSNKKQSPCVCFVVILAILLIALILVIKKCQKKIKTDNLATSNSNNQDDAISKTPNGNPSEVPRGGKDDEQGTYINADIIYREFNKIYREQNKDNFYRDVPKNFFKTLAFYVVMIILLPIILLCRDFWTYFETEQVGYFQIAVIFMIVALSSLLLNIKNIPIESIILMFIYIIIYKIINPQANSHLLFFLNFNYLQILLLIFIREKLNDFSNDEKSKASESLKNALHAKKLKFSKHNIDLLLSKSERVGNSITVQIKRLVLSFIPLGVVYNFLGKLIKLPKIDIFENPAIIIAIILSVMSAIFYLINIFYIVVKNDSYIYDLYLEVLKDLGFDLSLDKSPQSEKN